MKFPEHPGPVVSSLVEGLDSKTRKWAQRLDMTLAQYWRLGKNLTLVWCWIEGGARVLLMPFEMPAMLEKRRKAQESGPDDHFLRKLIGGARLVEPAKLDEIAGALELSPVDVPLPGAKPGSADSAVIDAIVRVYSITYVHRRAVALIDVVGFSRYSPLSQATQLNSLIYAVNSAHQLMAAARLPVRFVRSTTGDGFYMWNQDPSPQGNIHLYFLLHLLLADNAISRRRYKDGVSPRLKAAFHISDGYEFTQLEQLHPTMQSYIVGDVTIELARMLDCALPDQILIGDFHFEEPLNAGPPYGGVVDAVSFVDTLQVGIEDLQRIRLAGEQIRTIKCYLTGRQISRNGFEVSRLTVTDKHGLAHYFYNAKLNIHPLAGEPIYLGLQHKDAAAHTA